MIPLSADTAAAAGAKGGKQMTEAKAQALSALHARRRGIRLSPDIEARERVLEELREALRYPARGVVSVRACADALGVSDRTVRRWISEEDWPSPGAVAELRRWVRGLGRSAPLG